MGMSKTAVSKESLIDKWNVRGNDHEILRRLKVFVFGALMRVKDKGDEASAVIYEDVLSTVNELTARINGRL